jgi:hypothetical protein
MLTPGDDKVTAIRLTEEIPDCQKRNETSCAEAPLSLKKVNQKNRYKNV